VGARMVARARRRLLGAGPLRGRARTRPPTAGFDVRIWSFCFWGDRYRLRLSFAADGAARYTNALASLGFWH
jgi:hypothetical protein